MADDETAACAYNKQIETAACAYNKQSNVAVDAYIIIIFIFIVIVICVNKSLQDIRLHRLLLFSFVVFRLFRVRRVDVVFST